YISQFVQGNLAMVENIPLATPDMLSGWGALKTGTPEAFLGALHKVEMEGQEQGSENGTLGPLATRLSGLVDGINRFIRIYSTGEQFTISLHGLFAGLVHWDEEAAQLALNTQGRKLPLPGSRPLPGLLGDLESPSRELLGSGGLNFTSSAGALLAQLKELRWPLVVSGVLLGLWLVLLGTSTIINRSSLDERLNLLNNQVKKLLSVPLPESTATVKSAMSKISDEVEKLSKTRQTSEKFSTYSYDMSRLFNDISNIVSQHKQVKVETLSISSQKISLTGTTEEYSASDQVKTKLAELEYFKGFTAKLNHSRSGQSIRYRMDLER
ncbi:MAG: hypothetical protein OEZ59_12765, partial [Deltaproteobacteria bacterium]|nr:hypothetical protein [Deltaproteobacteria bacterium]